MTEGNRITTHSSGVKRVRWLTRAAVILMIPIIAVTVIYLTSIWSILVICYCVTIIREKHAGEVYILFLTFFVGVYLGIGIDAYLEADRIIFDLSNAEFERFANSGVLNRVLYWYVSISTDLIGEIKFLVSVVGLVIIPQSITFFISGLFGCGRRPALVSAVSKFVIFSLIKYLCIYSAFITAQTIFLYYQHRRYDQLSLRLFMALWLLSISFALTAFYYRRPMITDILFKNPKGKLSRITRYMTRFTITESETT